MIKTCDTLSLSCSLLTDIDCFCVIQPTPAPSNPPTTAPTTAVSFFSFTLVYQSCNTTRADECRVLYFPHSPPLHSRAAQWEIRAHVTATPFVNGLGILTLELATI